MRFTFKGKKFLTNSFLVTLNTLKFLSVFWPNYYFLQFVATYISRGAFYSFCIFRRLFLESDVRSGIDVNYWKTFSLYGNKAWHLARNSCYERKEKQKYLLVTQIFLLTLDLLGIRNYSCCFSPMNSSVMKP